MNDFTGGDFALFFYFAPGTGWVLWRLANNGVKNTE